MRAAKSMRARSLNQNLLCGLVLLGVIGGAALFADYIVPYPSDVGPLGDLTATNAAPDASHIAGTDVIGRDVFSRVIYAYRVSLLLPVAVLGLAAPVGVAVGLVAGYLGGRLGYVLMRITDIFLSIPALVLAMAIAGYLEPNLTNSMIAVAVMWWPWYARLTYSLARIQSEEGYVLAARTVGASRLHIMLREILPNCLPAIGTKITTDFGFVIIIGASLSFVGLGAQAPTPDLGAMLAEGVQYMPDSWWLAATPALAMLLAVLACNLIGDGLKEIFNDRRD